MLTGVRIGFNRSWGTREGLRTKIRYASPKELEGPCCARYDTSVLAVGGDEEEISRLTGLWQT